MKKLGKLLALLASAVLICALCVLSVSALNADKASEYANFTILDYENKNAGDKLGLSDATRWGAFTVDQGDSGNKYMTYNYLTNTGNANLFEFTAGANTYDAQSGYKYSIAEYPYLAIDFDAMTETGTFAEGLGFFPFEKAAQPDDTGKRTEVGNGKFSGYSHAPSFTEGGKFGLITLDSTPYTWNHITFVMEFTPYADGTGATWCTHYFLNGEYVDTVENGGKTNYAIDDLAYSAIRQFRVNAAKKNSDDTKSTSIDNLQLTYYTPRFGTLAEIGKNVYDASYKLPFGKTVASIDGTPYDNIKAAFAALEAGDKITLHTDVKHSDGITVDKPIIVDTNKADGTGCYTFEYKATLVGVAEGGVVTFKEMDNASVAVYWDDCTSCSCEEVPDDSHYYTCPTCTCHSKGHSLFAVSEEVFLNAIPSYPGTLPETVVDENGVSYEFAGWSYTEGATEPDELVAITEDQVNSVDKYLSIFPVYVTKQYVVGIKDSAGEWSYYEEADFRTAINNAPNNSTVVFYKDYVGNAGFAFASKTVTVDLNGHSVTITSISTNILNVTAVDASGKETISTSYDNVNKPSAFNLGANATLTITSSAPGSEIYVSTLLFNQKKLLDGTLQDPVYDSIKGSAFVNVIGANSKVNVYGENIKTYTSELVDVWKPSANFEFYVKGGSYHRTVSDYSGLINNRFAAKMTFEDCELVSTLGTLIYVWDNTYKHNVESYTMSFKNCDFKTTETRSVFTFFGTECAVSFEGCNFAAAFNENNDSKLTFDDKCKFLYNYPADAIIADGLSFIEYPTEEKLTYSYNVFKVNGDRTGFLPESYTDLTVVDKTVSYKYIIDSADGITATINWVDAEGNLLETTVVAKNSTVAPPTVTVPVGDGWRNVKVVDWKNADGKVDYAIGSDNEYTFTAIIPEGEEAEYTVGITGALHNLTYYAHFRFNVYLPVTEGVSIVSTNYTKLSNVMIDGVEYYHYSAYPSTATAGRDYTMNLTYEIDGQQFKCDFTIGILVYAKYILNDTNSSAEELELVKAMLRYVEQAYIAAGNTVPAALSSLVKAYPAAAYPTVYPDADVNYDAIAEYVDTVALGVNGNQARYVVTVPKDVAVAGFTVDVREFTTEKVEQADGSLIFRTKNSKVYDLTKTVNIDVYNSDGELVATAPYSAGAYINATDSVLAKATYAFGEAILAYFDSIE